MIVNTRMLRQIVMWSMVALIFPMVLFPQRFGTSLVEVSLLSILTELVFYGVVLYLSNRRISLGGVTVAAIICLGYRLLLGATLGLLIVIMYAMNMTISMELAMSGYLPAVIIQALATPFILRPALDGFDFANSKPRRRAVRPETPAVELEPIVFAEPEAGLSESHAKESPPIDIYPGPRRGTAQQGLPDEISGFERATEYIGENGAVKMAAVIDSEGLLLGSFVRGGADAEDWAPQGLLFESLNDELLARSGFGSADRISLSTADYRVVIAHEERFHLMVVAQRQHDDVLNVRIEQGLEMMRKYVAERYSDKLFVNAEKEEYVRSTE